MENMEVAKGGSAAALSPNSVGGSRKRVKRVSAKTIKRTLRKLGMRPKGRMVLKGGEDQTVGDNGAAVTPEKGGRRGRKPSGTKKGRKPSGTKKGRGSASRRNVSLARMVGL